MVEIVIDTNIFLSIFELKVDFLTQIQEKYGRHIVTLQHVVDELAIKGTNGRMALDLIAKRNIKIIEYRPELPADDALLHFCTEKQAILATQDATLAKRGQHKHLKILRIRQRGIVM